MLRQAQHDNTDTPLCHSERLLCHSQQSEESSCRFTAIRPWKMLRCPTLFWSGTQHDNIAVILSEAQRSRRILLPALRSVRPSALFVILSEAKNLPAGLSLSGLGRTFDARRFFGRVLRGTIGCHSERSEESSRRFITIRHWKTLRQAQGDNTGTPRCQAERLLCWACCRQSAARWARLSS